MHFGRELGPIGVFGRRVAEVGEPGVSVFRGLDVVGHEHHDVVDVFFADGGELTEEGEQLFVGGGGGVEQLSDQVYWTHVHAQGLLGLLSRRRRVERVVQLLLGVDRDF